MTAFEVRWSNVHSPDTPESPLVPSLEVFFVRPNGKTIRRRFLVDSGADMSMAPRRLCLVATEAEWEYACRAGSTTRYPTGDDSADVFKIANVAGSPLNPKHPLPVGSLTANAWGLRQGSFDTFKTGAF